MPSILKSIEIFDQAKQQQQGDGTVLDESSNAPSILAINGFFCGFSLLVVLGRIYVRTIMLKSMGLDDWLIVVAMTCGVGVFVCFIGETVSKSSIYLFTFSDFIENFNLHIWVKRHLLYVCNADFGNVATRYWQA